jgi:hypothetical protein
MEKWDSRSKEWTEWTDPYLLIGKQASIMAYGEDLSPGIPLVPIRPITLRISTEDGKVIYGRTNRTGQ